MSRDDMQDDDRENAEQQAEFETQYAAWRESQDDRDLPEHKQAGYAERQREQSDMRRKQMREEA